MNERTQKILMDVIGIKDAFLIFNMMLEKTGAWESGYRLGNVHYEDITEEIRLLEKKFKDYEWKEREVLDVYGVAFYVWAENEYDEHGYAICSPGWELSHVELLTSESTIMPDIQPDTSGIPF